jgi:tetratricopeptide (TPR) repeat protein
MRIGIHTGAVVVGNMGDSRRHEYLAVGDTPNLAARVQGAARPNSVVVSDSTYRLTKGYFEFRDLGALSLKGFSQPTNLYEVVGDLGVKNRLDLPGEVGLTPFVGRESEFAFVLDRWKEAREGKAPVVILCGEPGIGKSRLVRALREKLGPDPVFILQCEASPLFQGTVLHPVLELIEAQLGFTRESSPADKLAKLRSELERVTLGIPFALPLLAGLLSIPIGDELSAVGLSPQRQRQATFETLVAWVHELSARRPLLFVFEDLQWADPSTLEFLGLLVERTTPGPLMLVVTHRSDFAPPWSSPRVSRLNLLRMSPDEAQQMIEATLDNKQLPKEIEQEILQRAEGVPLYVEEITKAVLESPTQRPAKRTIDVAPSSMPLAITASVRDSLTARLDRLGPSKAVVQLAATLGRVFQYDVLLAVSGIDEIALRIAVDRLTDSELLFRSGQLGNETFTFKHALIQDAAYASLLRATRQAYHHQIARVLTDRFPELADAQPELLARHFAGAGIAREALSSWGLAARRAIARSAYQEALTGFTRALEQLSALPQSVERDRQEVELRSTLGVALLSMRGYSAKEVEENYARASELCEQFGDLPLGVLYGVWAVHLVRNDRDATARLGRLFERYVQTSKDPIVLRTAYAALCARAFFCGEYAGARTFLTNALMHGEFGEGGEHRAALRTAHGLEGYLYPILYMAYCDLIGGFVDRARARWNEAMKSAEEMKDPYAIAMALSLGSSMACDARDFSLVLEISTRQMIVSSENAFPFWAASAHTFLGFSEVHSGHVDSGIVKIETALQMIQMIGAFIIHPYHKSLLADAYLFCGRVDDALRTVDEALTSCEGKLASSYVPMMTKLKADILACRGDRALAEQYYVQALSTVRQQGAKLFELQIALAFARLLCDANRQDETRALLSPIVESFTEGFDLPDFKDARALLDKLS